MKKKHFLKKTAAMVLSVILTAGSLMSAFATEVTTEPITEPISETTVTQAPETMPPETMPETEASSESNAATTEAATTEAQSPEAQNTEAQTIESEKPTETENISGESSSTEDITKPEEQNTTEIPQEEAETDQLHTFVLPILDGVDYIYDETYYNQELSTNLYDVLSYYTGEKVTLEIDAGSDMEYAVFEQDTEEVFLSHEMLADKKEISFLMPDKDLTLGFTESDSIFIPETEAASETELQELPEETTIEETKDTIYPEAGVTIMAKGISIEYDCWTFDPAFETQDIYELFNGLYEVDVEFLSDDIQWTTPGTYSTFYRVNPKDDASYIWYVERPVTVLSEETETETETEEVPEIKEPENCDITVLDGPLAETIRRNPFRANATVRFTNTGKHFTYSATGMGSGGDTGEFKITYAGKTWACYCVQPGVAAPETSKQDKTATSKGQSTKIAKILYYCSVNATGYNDVAGSFWKDKGYTGFSVAKKKLLVHLAASSALGRNSWRSSSFQFGKANQKCKDLVDEMLAYIEGKAAVPTGTQKFVSLNKDVSNLQNSGVGFALNRITSYKDGSGNTISFTDQYQSQRIYFNTDDPNAKATFRTPSNVRALVFKPQPNHGTAVSDTAPNSQFSLTPGQSVILYFHKNSLGAVNQNNALNGYRELAVASTAMSVTGSTAYLLTPQKGNQEVGFLYQEPKGKATNLYVNVPITTGYLRVHKASTDAGVNGNGNYSLAGAVYGVYNSAGARVAGLTTGADGYSTSIQLTAGTYTLREEVAPPGYVLNSTPITVTVTTAHTAAAPCTAWASDAPIKGYLRVQKSSDLGATMPNGNYSLAGAVYTVYNSGGAVVGSVTTNAQGTSNSIALFLGTYTVRETTAPAGHNLDSNTYTVTISAGHTAAAPNTVHSTDYSKKSCLKLVKSSDLGATMPNGNYSLEGAVYGVFNANGGRVGSLTTQANGHTNVLTLPIGSYTIREETAPKGHTLNATPINVTTTVNHTSTAPYVAYASDAAIRSNLKLVKTDSETGTVLNNTYYSMEGAVYGVFDTSGGRVGTLTTGINGHTNVLNLPMGTYTVKEEVAPKGYALNTTPISVTLTAAHTTAAPYTVQTSDAPTTGSLSIQKISASGEPGAIWENRDLTLIKFKMEYLDDLNVEPITFGLDEKGYCKKEVRKGRWLLTETSSTEYHKPGEPQEILIDGSDQGLKLNISNERYEGMITLAKRDLDTGKLIIRGNTTFQILDELRNPVSLTVKGTGKKTDTFVTDADGTVWFDESIPGGKYILKELIPPEGYKLGPETVFEITEDTNPQKPIEIAMHDKRVYANVSILKKDAVSGNHAGAGFKFYIIADEDIKDVGGNIYDGYAAGNVVETITTGQDGVATSTKGLMPGKYHIEEAEAAQGYYSSTKKIPFEVVEAEVDGEWKAVVNPLDGGELAMKDSRAFTTITLDKKDSATGGNMPEGVVFRIIADEDIKDGSGATYEGYAAGTVIEEITTNENGHAVSQNPLYPGKYHIEEVSTLNGYLLSEEKLPFEVISEKDGNAWKATAVSSKTEGFVMVNDRASFIVKKEMDDGSTPDDEFTFILTDANGQPMNANYYIYNNSDWSIAEEMPKTTDADGSFKIRAGQSAAFYGLPIDTVYTVKEVPMEGYLDISPEIDEGYPNKKVQFFPETLEFLNEVPSSIILKKVDVDDNSILLKDAVFGVYTSEDCSEDSKVMELTTDENGMADTGPINKGVYYIKEIKEPFQYKPSIKVHKVEALTPAVPVELTIENKLAIGSVKLIKYGSDGSSRLRDVTFELKNEAGEVQTKTTDGKGEVLFENLLPGTYELTETKTVAGNNLLPKKVTIKIPATYTEEEKNLPVNKGIDFSDAYYDDAEQLYYMYDQTYHATNYVRLTMPASGAEGFLIYPVCGAMCILLGAVILVRKKRAVKK